MLSEEALVAHSVQGCEMLALEYFCLVLLAINKKGEQLTSNLYLCMTSFVYFSTISRSMLLFFVFFTPALVFLYCLFLSLEGGEIDKAAL